MIHGSLKKIDTYLKKIYLGWKQPVAISKNIERLWN